MKRPLAEICAALVLAGCARQQPMPDALPSSMAGWTRSSMQDLAPAQAPDRLPDARIEAVRRAEYEGAGKLDARVYALPTTAVALDVAQRWTPLPDSVFFAKDRFFVVVSWKGAERKAVQAFVSELQKRFPEK